MIYPTKEFVKSVLYKDPAYLAGRNSIFQYMKKDNENIWEWAWNRFPIYSQVKLLEVGTGLAPYWQQNISKLANGCELFLTDASEGMLNEAKKIEAQAHSNIFFRVEDVEQLTFADSCFDIVFAHFVLYYAENPFKALKELKRVVKPGGVVCIFTLHSDSLRELYELANEVDKRIPKKDLLLEKFDQESAENYIKKLFSTYDTFTYTADIIISRGMKLQKTLESIGATYNICITPQMSAQYQEKIENYINKYNEIRTSSIAMFYVCYR